MPKMMGKKKPKKKELPKTLVKSSKKAQRTFAKAHDSALEEYGSEERAHRVGYKALKHSYEKVGGHWERKEKGKRGPSDERSARGGRHPKGRTAEGVDTEASKDHLLSIARRLDISGRSTMKKKELVAAIEKENRRKTSGGGKKKTSSSKKSRAA